MAEPEPTPARGTVQAKKLKYLDFVQVAAVYVGDRLSTVYEYAKEKSGPLKPGVQAVESTVKAVMGPVYDMFHDVPFELLNLVDTKVDKVITGVDSHAPSLIKQASSQALAVASEVWRDGVVNTARNIVKTVYTKIESTAKEYYSKCEPLAKQYAVVARKWLNQLPLLGLPFRLIGNLFVLLGYLLRLLGNLLRWFKFFYKLGFDSSKRGKLLNALRLLEW